MSDMHNKADWIGKVFEQLVHSLDDICDIVDFETVLQSFDIFDQIELTKEQLISTNIVECIKDLHAETPNEYMKFRLAPVLIKWNNVLQGGTKNTSQSKKNRLKSASVFEAVIKDDDRFFKTKSIPELLHRLLKSCDKEFKVTDMATVLNTIDKLERIKISASLLATTHLVTYIRRLRKNTTNKFLSARLRQLLRKWRDLVQTNEKTAHHIKA